MSASWAERWAWVATLRVPSRQPRAESGPDRAVSGSYGLWRRLSFEERSNRCRGALQASAATLQRTKSVQVIVNIEIVGVFRGRAGCFSRLGNGRTVPRGQRSDRCGGSRNNGRTVVGAHGTTVGALWGTTVGALSPDVWWSGGDVSACGLGCDVSQRTPADGNIALGRLEIRLSRSLLDAMVLGGLHPEPDSKMPGWGHLRRRKDSNLRMVAHRRFSKPLPSTTRPRLHRREYSITAGNVNARAAGGTQNPRPSARVRVPRLTEPRRMLGMVGGKCNSVSSQSRAYFNPSFPLVLRSARLAVAHGGLTRLFA